MLRELDLEAASADLLDEMRGVGPAKKVKKVKQTRTVRPFLSHQHHRELNDLCTGTRQHQNRWYGQVFCVVGGTDIKGIAHSHLM
jgi:hypothetical protein